MANFDSCVEEDGLDPFDSILGIQKIPIFGFLMTLNYSNVLISRNKLR